MTQTSWRPSRRCAVETVRRQTATKMTALSTPRGSRKCSKMESLARNRMGCLPGSSAPPAAERGATGEQHNGGAAASAGGHGGNAASTANGVPGAEIPGFTAETLGIMMRAFSQAASSSEGRERNVNVKLAKMPTHGDRTLPSIKAWTQWYDVRLKSWAGAQTPGFVEATGT